MGTKTSVVEFSYVIRDWVWDRRRATVLRDARKEAARKGMDATGEPQVHVVLVWPQEQGAESAA